jgi:hypothetical protein
MSRQRRQIKLAFATAIFALLAFVIYYLVAYTGNRLAHVPPAEREIAELILSRGGAYHIDWRKTAPIEEVDLRAASVSDADFAKILELEHLRIIALGDSRLSDESADALLAKQGFKWASMDVKNPPFSKSAFSRMIERGIVQDR